MTRSPASARNFRTWLLGHVLLFACTAPPRAEPPPPPRLAPLPKIHVTFTAPGVSAEELKTHAVAVVERALIKVPEVDAVVARADDGRATIAAVVTNPDAIESIRGALNAVHRDLPPSLESPVLSRASDDAPVLALRMDDDPLAVDAVIRLVERIAGVGHVEQCGGRERVIRIDLDRRRLAGVPIDRVVDALRGPINPLTVIDGRMIELNPDRLDLGKWLAIAIPDTQLHLSDLATISDSVRAHPCTDLVEPKQVVLSVYAQHGADRRRVAADIRAADLRADLPPVLGPLTLVPDAERELAALEIELASRGDALDGCLHDAGLGPWMLLRRQPAQERAFEPIHARLLIAAPPTEPGAPAPTRTIGHVRDALARCPGVERAAVLAPDADADHLASVELLGPDPAVLADLADRAAARLRDLPGVSLLKVHAARPRPRLDLVIDRNAAAERGIRIESLATAVRLVVGPLDLGDLRDTPVLLDLPDRPGAIEQVLPDLSVSSPAGPVPLTALVRVSDAPSTLAPLYRIAQSDAAAVELRLRRAADREAVLDALERNLELPIGVQLRLGREFPPLDR